MKYSSGVTSQSCTIPRGGVEHTPMDSSLKGIGYLLLMLFARTVGQTLGVGNPFDIISNTDARRYGVPTAFDSTILADNNRFTVWTSGSKDAQHCWGKIFSINNDLVKPPFLINTLCNERKSLKIVTLKDGNALNSFEHQNPLLSGAYAELYSPNGATLLKGVDVGELFGESAAQMHQVDSTAVANGFCITAKDGLVQNTIRFRCFNQDVQPRFQGIRVIVAGLNVSVVLPRLLDERNGRVSLFWASSSDSNPDLRKLKMLQFNPSDGLVFLNPTDISFDKCPVFGRYSLSKLGKDRSVVFAECYGGLAIRDYSSDGTGIGLAFPFEIQGTLPAVERVTTGALVVYWNGEQLRGQVVGTGVNNRVSANFLIANASSGSLNAQITPSIAVTNSHALISFIDGERIVGVELQIDQLPMEPARTKFLDTNMRATNAHTDPTTSITETTLTSWSTPTSKPSLAQNTQGIASVIAGSRTPSSTMEIFSKTMIQFPTASSNGEMNARSLTPSEISSESVPSTALVAAIAAGVCAVLSSVGVTSYLLCNKSRQNLEEKLGHHRELDPISTGVPNDASQYDRLPPPQYVEISLSKSPASNYESVDSPLS